MTTQAPLWRTTDPRSSAAAAIELTDSGHRASQKARILSALKEHPGTTSSELAGYCGLSDVQIRKRLPDLEADGLVSPTGDVRKGVFRLEQTWRAV